MRTEKLLFGLLVLLASATSLPALAEEQVIEEIVVTATKRAQSISEVAGSVSAIGADAIEDRSINNVEDIQGVRL